ncbi:MAG: hypothetical protein R3F55_21115 [Alphaproteobacteria bacterium]
MDAWSLAVEAQQVVLLRSARLARGDQRARREAQRMVTEKIANGLSVAVDAAYGATRGRSPVAIAQAALRRSRRRVRANRRRLVRP